VGRLSGRKLKIKNAKLKISTLKFSNVHFLLEAKPTMSGHHDTAPDPRLEKRLAPEQTEALEERVNTLESLLIAKGLVSTDALDTLASLYESDLGPMNGAKVVAHAWVDAAYKARLLKDATAAIAEMGFSGLQGEHMVVVENTPQVHNVVVCTLCSCYPWPVLGLPPVWYKDAAYRSRVVIDPRGVLREFGLDVPDSTAVRVWDSSAEIRYLVLPERPAGSEHLSEEELAALITRDAMIGVTQVSLGK
jgi:nitrile hydratase subunit alpha